MKKVRKPLALTVVLLSLTTTLVRGQSGLDGFDPNANGRVQVVVVQPDGKILIGGDFTTLSPNGGPAITRNRIARLNPNGTVDPTFDANSDQGVAAIAVQTDGKILVGGDFTSIGGQPRNRIARLNPNGTVDPTFDANADQAVEAIALQADGNILVGGVFASIGGQPRSRIARLDATTGLADSFDPNANNGVHVITVQPDGKILVGGDFNGENGIGGQHCTFIARLDPTTGLADSPTYGDYPVLAIAMQVDSKILIGTFGRDTNSLHRLNPNLTYDNTFTTYPLWPTFAIAVQSDGRVLIGGDFDILYQSGGPPHVPRRNIARLNNSNGAVETAFDPSADSIVRSIAIQADGKILVGGQFMSIGGQQRNHIARLDTSTPGCAYNTWTAAFTNTALAARSGHTALWTGSEMIVWGGYDGSGAIVNSNGRYNPSSDSWTVTSAANAPSARYNHAAVWTGSEMIVWGGYDGGGVSNSGGRYNPSTDSWTAMSSNNAPTARGGHTAVWTGSEMIVWGGYDGNGKLNTGGRYNPATDTWTATSVDNTPSVPWNQRAVWTGGEMIVWGGAKEGSVLLNTSGRYNPSTDSWTAISNTNAPTAPYRQTAVWTDSEMIVWGGDNGFGAGWNSGGNYNPGTDTWTATSTNNAPIGRRNHTAVWAGGEMIVWGGDNDGLTVNSGGNYNPGTNTWTATSSNNAPTARSTHTAVWTGSEMIVWGGFFNDHITFYSLNTGSRYCARPVNILGTISYCSNPSPAPVPNVTLNLMGDASLSTITNGSGSYQLLSLTVGGNYIVTPSKAARTPGSAGIDTVDVVVAQLHFLTSGSLLSGCRLTAADVNGDTLVNTVDVVAIQRFFLGMSTGIANVGKYQFSPASRSYPGVVSDQIGQNYDALVFGDVVNGFVHRPAEGDPSQTAPGVGTNAGEVPAAVTGLNGTSSPP